MTEQERERHRLLTALENNIDRDDHEAIDRCLAEEAKRMEERKEQKRSAENAQPNKDQEKRQRADEAQSAELLPDTQAHQKGALPIPSAQRSAPAEKRRDTQRFLSSLLERNLSAIVKRAPHIKKELYNEMWRAMRELGWETAPALEVPLIEEVALTQIDLYVTRLEYGMIRKNLMNSIKDTREAHVAREVTRLERQLRMSIESLNRVRELYKRAPIQVNIAQQQVNTTG